MDEEKENSNKKNTLTSFAALGDNEKVYLQKNGIKDTDDSFKYEWKDIDCKISAIFDSNSKSFINSVSSDKDGLIGIILDNTSFYAESGGQIGDIGYIVSNSNDSEN